MAEIDGQLSFRAKSLMEAIYASRRDRNSSIQSWLWAWYEKSADDCTMWLHLGVSHKI